MPLVLRIDNVDTLPDGGPVFFEIDRRGIDIGRDSYLDWTLPDPQRIISGKHCEIHFREGGYWVHDVSTNGTSMNGQTGRLTEPYQLNHGDRIHIGHYIIVAELSGEEAGDAALTPLPSGTSVGGDPWGDVKNPAAAVDRRDFAAHARGDASARRAGDLAEEDISWGVEEVAPAVSDVDIDWTTPENTPASNTPVADTAAEISVDWATPAPSTPAARTDAVPPDWRDAIGGDAAPQPPLDPAPIAGIETPVEAPADNTVPSADPTAEDLETAPADAGIEHVDPTQDLAPEPDPAPDPFPQPTAPEPVVSTRPGLASQWADGEQPQQPMAPPLAPDPSPSPSGGGGFIAAFERGAGLPAGAVADKSDEALAEELGALFKTVAGNLQAMLHARAETKSAMRSSERTMIGALENNPLKFSPSPEDALRLMFGEKTRSYLDATQTIEQSFGDLQKHQLQTFGAMQQALQALIEDLDPENIADATSKDGGLAGLVSSRRAKFWDTYVERFTAKASRHERGMIDAFMILFAEMYDRQE